MKQFLVTVLISIFILFELSQCSTSAEERESDSINTQNKLQSVYSLIIPFTPIHPLNHISLINKKILDKAINASANYLINQQNIDGSFKYSVNLNLKPTPVMYNMLRHSGAIYSLMMYNELYNDEKSCIVSESAIEFLKNVSLRPLAKLEDILGIWSFPDLVQDINEPQLKLGGSGLGLVALLSVERCKPGSTQLKSMQQLGNFLCYLQKDDGSFYSKYLPDLERKDDNWISLYYPGEAALGLCLLYEIDRNEKWLKASLNAMNYLFEHRKGKQIVEADHWSLIATGRLLNIIRNIDTNYLDFENMLINHAIQICESMIITSHTYNENSEYNGCMTFDGRTTPTAARLEGLLAAYSYIPYENQSLRFEMIKVIEEGIRFLIRAQIKNGDYKGGMTRTYIADSNAPITIEISDEQNTEIRIDYVQHSLSAMIMYYQLFYPKNDI